MLDAILKILVWLSSWLRPPLRVEILKFSIEEERPGDPLVLHSRPERYYYCELMLTNRTHNVVYVRSIVLSGHHGKPHKDAALHEPLRLEPSEPKEKTLIFPISDGEEPVSGGFRIEVIPTIGRATKIQIALVEKGAA